jgi:hypothetical protein
VRKLDELFLEIYFSQSHCGKELVVDFSYVTAVQATDKTRREICGFLLW